MEKFKETNYWYSNGCLYKKDKSPLKIDKKNRYTIQFEGQQQRIHIKEVDYIKLYPKSYREYLIETTKKSKKTVFLPVDVIKKLKDNFLLTPPIAVFINKLLTTEKCSTILLPKRFAHAQPVEVSGNYKKMIGLKGKESAYMKEVTSSDSDIDKLVSLKIIEQVPYETTYKNNQQEVDYIRFHSKRYYVNTTSIVLKPFTFEYKFKPSYDLDFYDKKRLKIYQDHFKITNPKQIIDDLNIQIEIAECELRNKRTYSIIRKIAAIKGKINSIKENHSYFFRNFTNNREEKFLNQLENKNYKHRSECTTIKNMNSKDIICSQLRFLCLFLSNPDATIFHKTRKYYKDQVRMNAHSIKDEVIDLAKKLSLPTFWNDMMIRHNITNKDELKKQDLMPFLADYRYKNYDKKYFGKEFPKISELLCILNQNNYENTVYKNQFIVELQKVEADFVIDKVANVLVRKGVNVITLHDQWFYSPKYENLVVAVLNKFFAKYFMGLKNNYK
jgi:hypothetical protein